MNPKSSMRINRERENRARSGMGSPTIPTECEKRMGSKAFHIVWRQHHLNNNAHVRLPVTTASHRHYHNNAQSGTRGAVIRVRRPRNQVAPGEDANFNRH
ncbi:hypothetical protein CEXT_664501 [Caerostris extrusa]|uniref:Uncharacterized protein n=1 Tax=Caerostris extrusa TaxID=172846 RepID=A0AAV4WS78_CAEEX|nr:hypothetical protein CEXT_664501 [Caerostris extrusa]